MGELVGMGIRNEKIFLNIPCVKIGGIGGNGN